MDFAERKASLKLLEGLLTSGFLTYVEFGPAFSNGLGRFRGPHGFWNKFRKAIE
jgi:hypothetical protein